MVHILVVDDEEQIRNIIKKYAAFEGYQVSEAVDGMEAVEICRQKKFDLIIMDVMMPELDGFSACREIRKTSDTPVLMLSARGEEYDRIHGFEIGVDDYVVKPFSPPGTDDAGPGHPETEPPGCGKQQGGLPV